MRLDDINLLDKDVFAKGVPHKWFTDLRERSPVCRHPDPNGTGFWVVTKYVDVRAVSRDPSTFASPTGPLGEASPDRPERGIGGVIMSARSVKNTKAPFQRRRQT